MPIFRDYTPKRRDINFKVNSHRDHKPNLRIDFKERCGYCNAHDSWKRTYFEVDHFIPEHILTIKSTTDYSNLIYACRSCNNSKRKKWPTDDENIPNRNNVGFVDPCDDDYNSHFARSTDGKIVSMSVLGEWMYNALKLHKPHHAIIWNLERLEPLINEVNQTIATKEISQNLKDSIIGTFAEYNDYINQWKAL